MRFVRLQVLVAAALLSGGTLGAAAQVLSEAEALIELPKPRLSSELSVEKALQRRRSVRSFRQEPLSLSQVAQLLWAAQGVTAGRFRTAPSAGALYPLEVYLVAGNVDGLSAGVYRYKPDSHSLAEIRQGDVRKSLSRAAYWQKHVGAAAAALVFAGVYERTTGKYGKRGVRYVHIEVGHAAQNVYLQAEALRLGTVIIGAFMDSWVKSALHLQDNEVPLGIMPVGQR
jgi:SagB-type dehydrogenase family enzyme